MGRDELPQYFKKLGFKVGAEIGTYKGEFTEKFCKVGLKMFAIDPWLERNRQNRQDFLYEHTKRTLSPYLNCTIIRKTSMQALKDFKNESLDFVYIDGDHTFQAVYDDIGHWIKKVKIGGVVSGHDYFCTDLNAKNKLTDVSKAVDKYVAENEIKNLRVFGRVKNPNKEGKNDKYLSWMFFKHW